MKKDNHGSPDDVLELSSAYEVQQANKPFNVRISLLLNKISRKFNTKLVEDIIASTIGQSNRKLRQDDIFKDASIAQICFYIVLIVKLAKIDGKINPLEERVCLADFINSQYSYVEIKKIYNAAINDQCEAEFYINKLKLLISGNKLFCEQIITKMLIMAAIDGPVNKEELDFIKYIASNFKISNANFAKIFEIAFFNQMPIDPYRCLGVSKTISKDDLIIVYRTIAKKYHPDNYVKYKNIADEYRNIMQSKFDIYTKAYLKIKKNFVIK